LNGDLELFSCPLSHDASRDGLRADTGLWIPACAGMTGDVVMTKLKQRAVQTTRRICHSRAGTLLSGINVILAKAGIHNPVTTGIMDTRFRGYDNQPVCEF